MKVQEASSKSNSCTLVQTRGEMYFACTITPLVLFLLSVFQRVEVAGKMAPGLLNVHHT